MDITEVTTKSALVRSRIPGVEYVINPYTGCGHGCRYCYGCPSWPFGTTDGWF